jgi:hypothetical protein
MLVISLEVTQNACVLLLSTSEFSGASFASELSQATLFSAVTFEKSTLVSGSTNISNVVKSAGEG